MLETPKQNSEGELSLDRYIEQFSRICFYSTKSFLDFAEDVKCQKYWPGWLSMHPDEGLIYNEGGKVFVLYQNKSRELVYLAAPENMAEETFRDQLIKHGFDILSDEFGDMHSELKQLAHIIIPK